MAVLDFLFEGSPPQNVNSATVSQTSMPDWYQEYLRGLLGKSNAIAAEPFQPYTQPRVAPLNADQNAAFDAVRNNQGSYQPYTDQAGGALSAGAGGFNQNEFERYLNPHTSGVVDQIATLGARNLSEKLLPQVNSTFTGSGTFGGSRWGDFTSRALRDTNEAILNAQTQALNTGYNSAMNAFQTGQTQKINAGQQLGALGQLTQQAGLRDAAALQAVGDTQQQQGQKSADVAYQDFLEQRNYPQQQAQFLNQMIRGFNPPTQQSTNTNAPATSMGASPLAQLAGAVGTAYGLSKV